SSEIPQHNNLSKLVSSVFNVDTQHAPPENTRASHHGSGDPAPLVVVTSNPTKPTTTEAATLQYLLHPQKEGYKPQTLSSRASQLRLLVKKGIYHTMTES